MLVKLKFKSQIHNLTHSQSPWCLKVAMIIAHTQSGKCDALPGNVAQMEYQWPLDIVRRRHHCLLPHPIHTVNNFPQDCLVEVISLAEKEQKNNK